MNSTDTQGGGLDQSAWQIHDWIAQLHGANRVLAQNPNNEQAQQAVNDAWAYFGNKQQAGSQADFAEAGKLAPGIAGDALAGIVGFGRGASLGATRAITGKESLAAISAAHPKSALIGDALGTAATTTLGGAGLAAAKVPAAFAGATLLGGTGATRGAFDPILTGDRTFDAILGGLGGIVGGAIIGKIGEKVVAPIYRTLTPAIRNTAVKLTSYFGAKGLTGPEAEEATVSALRKYLTGLPEGSRPSSEAIETQLETVRKGLRRAVPARPLATGMTAPPVPRTVSDQLATPTHLSVPRGEDLQAMRAGESVAPVAGTEGRGFEVTGTRATPPVPTAPTLLEMQQGVTQQGMARAASEAAPPPTNVGARIRQLEESLGRKLTPDEHDRMLQRLLGPRTSKPGHPIWYGPGSPTITP
jgi:hypothetical protein